MPPGIPLQVIITELDGQNVAPPAPPAGGAPLAMSGPPSGSMPAADAPEVTKIGQGEPAEMQPANADSADGGAEQVQLDPQAEPQADTSTPSQVD